MKPRRLAVLLTSVVLTVFPGAPAPPASATALPASATALPASVTVPPASLCADQTAAALALKAQIDAHNAKRRVFRLPAEAGAYAAYNAEAAQLNARRTQVHARLKACIDAVLALADLSRSSLDITPPTKKELAAIRQARNNVPAGFTPPPAPPRGERWQIPAGLRPLYETLRTRNPGDVGFASLQGQARPLPGARDPAYPPGSGVTIARNAAGGSAATADHIIPLAQIMQQPGFLRLTPQNMYIITRAPINFQWLSFKANLSKSSRSVASMTGVDPAWRNAQLKLEDRVLKELRDIIKKLLKSQK